MRFLSDTRAQSIQVGAVLLFGVLIILLATWQAFVVPDQNEEIEFKHNQELQQQMTELRTTVNSMPDAATTRSVSLNLGVRYPSRTIFRNPAPSSGTVETVGTRDESISINIDNAVAEGEVGDFWNGSERTYNTGAIQYRPGYNRYSNAPRTIYEHSVLYNQFQREETTLPITGQALIDGNRITVVAINGSLRETRVDALSLDVRPVSTDTRTVTIDNQTNEKIILELPTQLDTDEWEDLLNNEQRVANVTGVDGGIRIELENGRYQLQMAKVGFGTRVTNTDAEYLTDIEGDGTTVTKGENQSLTVEVRDEFNNPKRDISINASADAGTIAENKESDGDGQATFEFDSQNVPGGTSVDIDFSLDDITSHNAIDPRDVTVSVTVEKPPSSGTGGGGGAYNVSWNRTQIANSPAVTETTDNFEYDATAEDDLSMAMFTDPSVDGADVEYAVSDQLLAVVDPRSGTTAADGTDSTTLKPRREGVVDVFTSSGSDGDRIKINITDVDLGLLTIDPDIANQASVHNWSFDNVPFRGEVDNITASYPAGTSFDGLDETDVTVYFTREGDSSPTNISVNDDNYSGTEAKFVLNKNFNRDIDGSSWVEIDGLENPDPGTYTAILTFRGENDTYTVEKEFTIPEKELTISAANSQIQAGEDNDISVTLKDEFGNSIQGDDVVLTVTDGDGTFAGGGTQTTVTTNTSGQATVTYESVSSDSGTTVQIDAELASNSTVNDTTSFSVDSTNGFSKLDVTNIVPNAAGQTQTFVFSPDTTFPSTASLDLILDDPQQESPFRVNYSDVAISSNKSLSTQSVTAGGDTATLEASFSNDIAPSETVRITVTEVNAGPLGNQNSSYDAEFDRSDVSGTGTEAFEVTRTASNSGLASVSVEDIYEYGSTQTQRIELSPDGSLEANERVAIDLSDAQAMSGSNYVTYSDVNSVTSGSVSSSSFSGDIVYVVYQAPSGGLSSSATITLEVSEAVIDGSSQSFEAGFSRATADTDRTTFDVRADDTAPSITPVDPQDGDQTNDNQTIIEATITDGGSGSGVDPSTITVSALGSNGNGFDGAGTGTAGISYSGGTLTIDISQQDTSYADGDVSVDIEVDDNVDNTATASYTFTVDTRSPMITPVDPQDGDTTLDQQKPIEASITDNLAGVNESSIRVTVVDDTGTVFNNVGTSDGAVEYSGDTLFVNISERSESYATGDVTVNITADDNVVNSATTEYTFSIEQQADQLSNAQNVQASSSSNDGFQFGLENQGSSTISIAEIEYTSDSSINKAPEVIEDKEGYGGTFRELNGPNLYSSRINLGEPPVALDSNADISGGQTKTFELGQFYETKNSGNEQSVNTNNVDAIITLVMSDGSTKEIRLNR